MTIPGFDYEADRIWARTRDELLQCWLMRDGEKHILIFDWILTHDGDVPGKSMEIDPAKVQRVPSPLANSGCKFLYTGTLGEDLLP